MHIHANVQYNDQRRKLQLISTRYRSVPIHLNWKGMFHDSSLLVAPNTEGVDGVRDNLDAEQATIQLTDDGR